MCHTMIMSTCQVFLCFMVLLEIVDPTNIIQDYFIGTRDLPKIY